MTKYSPTELVETLGSGLLSFPVTHFDADLQFDEPAYRAHLEWLSGYPVAGLFAAGGTGEGFSLNAEETDRVVRAAIAGAGGKVPVLAPATGSTVNAVAQVQAAEAAGADGILLMPPYLTEAGQRGLVEHISAVCAATNLGVIFYSRANAVLGADALEQACQRNANLVGFKDGVGAIEQMTRTYAQLGDRLIYVGGLPTAEIFALPLLQLGVTTYSSRDLQLRAAVRARLLRRRAPPGPDRGLRDAQRLRHPLHQDPRPRVRLRRVDRQGRPRRRRSPRRSGPPAAVRPARRRARRAADPRGQGGRLDGLTTHRPTRPTHEGTHV